MVGGHVPLQASVHSWKGALHASSHGRINLFWIDHLAMLEEPLLEACDYTVAFEHCWEGGRKRGDGAGAGQLPEALSGKESASAVPEKGSADLRDWALQLRSRSLLAAQPRPDLLGRSVRVRYVDESNCGVG